MKSDPASRQRVARSLAFVGAVILVGVAPILSVVAASTIAGIGGCAVDEGSAHPCVIAGIDVGGALYTMGVAGWLALLTVPTSLLVLVAYTVMAAVRWLLRRIRSRPGGARIAESR